MTIVDVSSAVEATCQPVGPWIEATGREGVQFLGQLEVGARRSELVGVGVWVCCVVCRVGEVGLALGACGTCRR